MNTSPLHEAVAAYGANVKSKLSNSAITGAPEDQIRAPLENLVESFGAYFNFSNLTLVGETTLAHLKTRPDYGVSQGAVLIGFIEVKAPGKGSDPKRFSDPHDKSQWDRLKALPNLIYPDGQEFSLWRNGERIGKPARFESDIATAGAKLALPSELAPLIHDFLTWQPEPPPNAEKLAATSARLCRLLREEVVNQIEDGQSNLTRLADEWRSLLFPEADNTQFADGYAQAVTFGLLIARAYDIDLTDGIDLAALKLKKNNSLIGTALTLLTENAEIQTALSTSLKALCRVLGVVDWHIVSKDKPDAWLNFYEDFLDVYDKDLKKKTGSYYTPPEVVEAMVRLVDEALRGPLFERANGLASPDVTIADPAVGTGTFLLGVMRRIASTIAEDQGEGAVRAGLSDAMKRLYGFELQFGPFAVAQLRILAEWQSLAPTNSDKSAALNLFITDTLGNPYVEEETMSHLVEAVAKSRRDANRVKRNQPITVVIGNPPYKEKAEGRGGWIESGTGGKLTAPLDRWKAPVEWGLGAHGKHLKNLYIYFWRWATLKVFGTGQYAATGVPDRDEEGLICFITVSGFLNGPGFQKMRDDLRRTCSEIWVIDCSPEGHQPEVATRIFQAVQQPVCIVLAAKCYGKAEHHPATVRFRALPPGRREAKFAHLGNIKLHSQDWQACSNEWRAPFLPDVQGVWRDFPKLGDLFLYNGSGVMPGRTWVIAPDRETLEARWKRLQIEKDPETKEKLFHPHIRNKKLGDKHLKKVVKEGLKGQEIRTMSVATDNGNVLKPIQYGYRTFDRQWLIPDSRLINQPNPTLWNAFSKQQIFLTGLESHSPSSGPAISFTHLIPDLSHYKGSFGGRVYPLWSDARASAPNIKPALLALLAQTYGVAVSAEDAFAYIAAVMAHPAFTSRFAEDLIRPGLRVPLTADAALYQRAVKIGREIIWLHTYGERYIDAAEGQPKGAPRMAKPHAPFIPKDGAIPPAPEPLPDTIRHDAETNRLHIGKGYVENVTKAMWDYNTSGKSTILHWFSYRKLDRTRPIIGDRRPPSPLEQIQPDGWLAEYTQDLLDLLHVLGRLIACEPEQAALLAAICDGPLIPPAVLAAAGLSTAPDTTANDVDDGDNPD